MRKNYIFYNWHWPRLQIQYFLQSTLTMLAKNITYSQHFKIWYFLQSTLPYGTLQIKYFLCLNEKKKSYSQHSQACINDISYSQHYPKITNIIQISFSLAGKFYIYYSQQQSCVKLTSLVIRVVYLLLKGTGFKYCHCVNITMVGRKKIKKSTDG